MVTLLTLLAIVYVFFIPITIQGMYHNKWRHGHKDFLSFYKDTKRFGALATVIYYILTSFTLVWFVVIKLINIIVDDVTITFNKIKD